MNYKVSKDLYLPYWILAAIRVLLVLVPQIGYIHPDEYFQSIEVLAGNILNVEINRPWEFEPSFPIRSVAVPYLTIGTGLKILKTLKTYFEMNTLTPYFIIVIPRLLICCLSFLVDFSIYRICVVNNEKYKSRLLTLSSSYIMIVYGTRTFSNTFEIILFALLLYFVSDSMTFSNDVITKREYLNKRYEKAITVVEKAKIHKLRLYLRPHSYKNCFQIATITVVGFFNRPTFLLFAFCPVFFWFYRGIGYKSVLKVQFYFRMLLFILSTIPTTLLFIIIDSFYYGYISVAEIDVSQISINNFIVTPVNFLKYNMNPKNLAQHGLHPKFVHLLVNVPLLFNVLGLLGIFGLCDILVRILKCKYNHLPTVRSVKGLMIASLIAPIALLSIFPHQEPRFIIPVIVPLVYLYGPTLFREPDYTVIRAYVCYGMHLSNTNPKMAKFLLKVWFVANILLLVFYGFIHQGGIYPAISHLSHEFKSKSALTNFHVITSHLYSIPESLFLEPPSTTIYFTNHTKYQKNKRIVLHEYGSDCLNKVVNHIASILNITAAKAHKFKKYKIYLMLPTSLSIDFENAIDDSSIYIKNSITFYPHLSTEAFAFPDHFFNLVNFDWKYLSIYDSLKKFCQLFGLKVYQLSLNV